MLVLFLPQCRSIYIRMLARKKLQLTTETDTVQPIFAVSPTSSIPSPGGMASPRIELARKPLTNSGSASRGVKRPAAALSSGGTSPNYNPLLPKKPRVTEGKEFVVGVVFSALKFPTIDSLQPHTHTPLPLLVSL